MMRFRRKRKHFFNESFELFARALIGLPFLGALVYLFFQPLFGIIIATYLGISLHYINKHIGKKYYEFAFRSSNGVDLRAFQNAKFYRDAAICGLGIIGMHCCLALIAPFSPTMLLAGILCLGAIVYKVHDLNKEKPTEVILHLSLPPNIPASFQRGMNVEARLGDYLKSFVMPNTYIPLTHEGIWFQMGREAEKRNIQAKNKPDDRKATIRPR